MLIETLLGGVTGLLGNVITSIMNYKTQKLKNDHEIALVKVQTEAMIAEAKAQIEITKARIEGEVEIADSQAYMESIKHGNQTSFSDKWIDKLFSVQGKMRYFSIPIALIIAFLFGLIEWIKQFMRPGLTTYTVLMTTWITFTAYDILKARGIEALTADKALGIFNDVTSIVIYLTVSCVTWWFGDRRVAKFLMRLKDGNTKQ